MILNRLPQALLFVLTFNSCAAYLPTEVTPATAANHSCPPGSIMFCDHRRGVDGRCACQTRCVE